MGVVEQWVINAADPPTLARFWAAIVGGEPVNRADGWAVVRDIPGMGRLSFQPDPRPRNGRVRVHADVRVADLATAIKEAEALGARRVGGTVTDDQGSFQVMRDPERNGFCLVTPR
ncbi:VOC family protein [Spiractinospora alimapuensis]|nr:VOC family protein [Spiractinospora alimapuensis]